MASRGVLAGSLAALGLACFAAGRSGLVEGIELKTLDWRQAALPPAGPAPQIVLLMLDQQSLDHLEKDGVYWPWPRSVYNAVLEFCKAGGAKAVVFDALFTSPSPYGLEEDEAFARGLERAGPVVMAMEMGSTRPGSLKVPERFSVEVAGSAPAAVSRRSARLPVPRLLAAARRLGDTASEPDPDGIFRRVSLLSELEGKRYPSLAAAAAAAAWDWPALRAEPDALYFGRTRVPLVEGRLLIRYRGRSPYPSYPLGRVIQSWQNIQEGRAADLAPGAVAGKLVLVGYSAPGLLDLRPSPLSPKSPGTQIIAAAADTMISGNFLRRAPRSAAALLILLGLGAGAAAALRLKSLARALAAAGLFSCALAAAALIAFAGGLWLDMLMPQAAIWLGFAAASAHGYAVEGRKKREIQRAFSHYLAPEVVAELAENPEKLALGGERRELSCYFSDIEGFTTISESLPPERLSYLMNLYLGEMTETVLESKGTLDKYIGDAIMAFWGAPIARPDHAAASCRAAVENQRKLGLLRERLLKEGFPPVRARIGLHSGAASVGNMGSARRFSYTAIGDDINLASRLEGANKVYGSYILISEQTRRLAQAQIETRELDLIKVKGKKNAVRVYELLGLKGGTEPALLARARRFEEALAVFGARRWPEALRAFESLLKEFGADESCALYIERCAQMKAAPPPEDWDGAFALKEK